MPLTLGDFITLPSSSPKKEKKMADASIYLRKNLVPRQVLMKHPKLAVTQETRALFAAAAQNTLNNLFSTEPSIVYYTYNKGRVQRIKLL